MSPLTWHYDSGSGIIDLTLAMKETTAFTGPASPWIAPNLREVTITIGPDERFAKGLRKGLPVSFTILDEHRFTGTVVRKGKNRLVCWGEIS